MAKEEPSCVVKMLQDFRPGSVLTPRLHFRGSNRLSGAFPLPSEVMSTPSVLGPKDPFKRPFDETLLNENDKIIKTKRRKSVEDSQNSDTSFGSDTSVPGSPWETRRARAELVEARAEILTLEGRIERLHGLRKEAELLFHQEKASLKQAVDRERSTVEKLENRLKAVKKREHTIKEDLEEVVRKLTKEKLELDTKTTQIQVENLELKKKLSEVEEKSGEYRREANSLAVELAGVKKESEVAREQLAALNATTVILKRAARQAEIDKAALTSALIKIAEMENELKNQADSATLVKSQQKKLMRYSEVERQLTNLTQEYSKLRQSTSNSLYLEGVVEDLRGRVKSLSEREEEVKALRVEVGVAEGRLADWALVAATALGGGGEPSPSALSAYLKSLHADHLLSAARAARLQAEMKTMEENHQSVIKEHKNLIVEMGKLKTELEANNTNIRRLKKQNTLITWERNDLRSLVDSCQKEVTMHCPSGLDPRVDALEKLVEGYRRRLEQLEQNPDLIPSNIQSGGIVESEAEDKAKALKKERDELKARVEQLEGEMEHRVLKGDFNVRDTKIVHLRMNPLSEAEKKRNDELGACQGEVVKLRERVKLLQEGQTADLTQIVETKIDHVASKQIEELEEKVKSQEVQNQRLREAFKAKGHEFREAIFSLLGYKVDSLPNKVYRLSSLYAQSPENHLIFKMSSNGDMELLETEFSTTLSDLIDLHLCQHHSIPLFLSTITIDLFQSKTHSQF